MDFHVTLWDLLLIYLLPFVVWIAVYLIFLVLLFVGVKLPFTHFDFRYDLLYLFESQRNLKRFKNKSTPFLRFYLKTMIGDTGTQALFLYRISRFFHFHGFRLLADGIHRWSKFATQIDISPYARIGRGLLIYHGSGVVIGKNTIIGERCLICQGVTTGNGAPKIGHDVKLWAGAKILGNIEIGDGAEIGANAVVVKSIPADCIAMGVPADRIIQKNTGA